MPSATASSTASFNAADVTFAQMMKPHHEGAVAMSDVLLAKQGIDQRVVDLAKAIKAAQQPEIVQLSTWLKAWGADSNMAGMNMSMAPGDMSALEKAQGTEAAKLFLQQMTVHHQSAIQMAQAEITNGKDPAAKKLAQDIVTSQTAEIETMKTILASL